MVKLLALFLIFLGLAFPLSAQITFQKTYGDSTVNEIGQSILQTSDGGFLIAATRYTTGNWIESLFLIRTNNVGDTLWTRLIKEPAVNYSGSQVIQTLDGGFAITGIKGGGVTSVPYLLKIDSTGNLLWNKTYLWFADEHINSIVQTPDSGFLLAGYLYNGNSLAYFIRTNSAGDTLWTKSYEESLFNVNIYSARISKDGGFIAAGSIQNTTTQDVDAFLFKTDSAGNVLWARGYGDVGYDYAQQVEVTSDSGFVIAAVTYSFGAGLADFYMVKTDASGTLQWSKTYGGSSDDRSESIRQTTDGGYLFTGESASFSSGNFDCYMVRSDANGDTLWTKSVSGLQSNEGYASVLTSDSGFAMTGSFLNSSGNYDVLLFKAGASGTMDCTERSTPAAISIPAAQVINHHLAYVPSEPLLVSQALDVTAGAEINTLCSITGSAPQGEKNELILFPDPVQNRLAISGLHCSRVSIDISDIAGMRYLTFKMPEMLYKAIGSNRSVELDVSILPPGIYFLKVQSERQFIVRKFVRQ